ncbi:galactose-1-phosphate uridylyltransferase [candidate division TA06 bacterium]|uniref:Galactose-1-phosphate uridylyltransferase n=1 Tax=candidate division TA06 bacterium TaxID=2250710 RepID=A0A933IA82_UNCT6|nr:galactose-1-phosphate uridylyltransferase [candidate division TA06 bacterium]
MPELRKDPIIGRWVIISTERGKRPVDYDIPIPATTRGSCPFCYGQEHLTTPEILAVRPPDTAPNSPGWQLRVIANKYPALRVEGELEKSGEGLYDKMSGIGAHEIIVEMPEHNRLLSDLDIPHLQNILAAYVSRMQDLKRDTRLKYLMIFKNQGYRAGASLEHSHSQLIATPIVPKTINEELAGAQEYYRYKERCVFCDIVKQETEDRRRLVLENENFISIAPFAARFPFECWLLPKKHESNFENIAMADLALLAPILKETLLRIKASVNNPPFNLVIHTDPCQLSGLPHFHWHMEIMPRLTRVAGFERGTGFYLNPTPPEEYAQFLREVDIV